MTRVHYGTYQDGGLVLCGTTKEGGAPLSCDCPMAKSQLEEFSGSISCELTPYGEALADAIRKYFEEHDNDG